jgi:sarcosine oxidase subunit gamma
LWFGQHTLLVGAKPDEKLTNFGILTDQSDAWVILRMSGGSIEDIITRLSPIDVRLKAFKSGDVVRTSLMHVNVTLHRVGTDTIDVYGFRSMAKTLCHELTQALSTVVARH